MRVLRACQAGGRDGALCRRAGGPGAPELSWAHGPSPGSTGPSASEGASAGLWRLCPCFRVQVMWGRAQVLPQVRTGPGPETGQIRGGEEQREVGKMDGGRKEGKEVWDEE